LNYLLDTNVLSEATREQPDGLVAAWLSERKTEECYISVVSVAEIRKGILMLPQGKKRKKLENWLAEELLPAFIERVITLGEEEMNTWAMLQVEAEKEGRNLPVVDSLIAATARCHELTLATRNIQGFQHCKIPVLNPWIKQKR